MLDANKMRDIAIWQTDLGNFSGTRPKAGGPHYLQRFVTEKTVTNNTAA